MNSLVRIQLPHPYLHSNIFKLISDTKPKPNFADKTHLHSNIFKLIYPRRQPKHFKD